MQEIIKKLHKKVMDEFYPVAEEMAKNGADKDKIVDAFRMQLKLKAQQHYDKEHGLSSVADILKDMGGLISKQSADSKTEQVFYNLLTERGISFNFQYSIGPYRADYLFAGFLIVELDGPVHNKEHDEKRDQYMRKLGYKIMRVPVYILAWCPDAVIDEIEDVIKGVRLVPNVRKAAG